MRFYRSLFFQVAAEELCICDHVDKTCGHRDLSAITGWRAPKTASGGDRDEFVKAGSKKVLFDSAEGLLEKLHRLGDKLQVISLGPCAKNPRTDRSGGSLGF
ncbi:MAG: hypothetical protein PWP64_308 [Candidatus Cloacimonadota bacterium]|nr:hypothetical protein [Candidatus Cloacimonadota bacterium]